MRVLIVVSLLLTLAATSLSANLDLTEWNQFKREHGKVYDTPEEEQARLKIFLERKEEIKEHNELYEKGLSTYWMGINHLSDMTHEEISQKYKGGARVPVGEPRMEAPVEDEPRANLPASVDWRKNNLVTPVKTQGSCGGCWAFSTTGAVEGQWAKKTGKLVSLSEQQLIDCNGDNMNCANGGWMTTAYQYIMKAGGIESEQEYAYKGLDHQSCKFKKNLAKASVKGFVDLPSGNEQALAQAVAHVGPIAVGMDARAKSFDNYKGGIYDESNCSSVTMDHGVLVVGYGSEKGVDYWIVKNSWGPQYGEHGYIRIRRNHNNRCAVATAANYPTV